MSKVQIRKKPLFIRQEIGFSASNNSFLMSRIQSSNEIAYTRESDFVVEIIWEGCRFINPKKPDQQMIFPIGSHLFRMVKADALEYLKHNKIKIPKKYPSEVWNESYRYKKRRTPAIMRKEIRIDLNHAYWRIAFNLGIIREKTYISGLDKPEYKPTRLSALSVLGKGKEYRIIRQGRPTSEIIRVGEDQKLEKIYSLIRHTCYKHMMAIYKLLGKDFLFYKVDEVGFYGSRKNLEKVKNYLKEHNLPAKEYI
jgi:hypothetical protein